jgi:hypothetical protein
MSTRMLITALCGFWYLDNNVILSIKHLYLSALLGVCLSSWNYLNPVFNVMMPSHYLIAFQITPTVKEEAGVLGVQSIFLASSVSFQTSLSL